MDSESTTEAAPITAPAAKKRKGSSRRTHGRTKPKKAAKAAKPKAGRSKSKPTTRASKRPASRPKHWSDKHAQLVLHATPELVAKLDRKLSALGKRLKCKPSRGGVIRALVEKAIK